MSLLARSAHSIAIIQEGNVELCIINMYNGQHIKVHCFSLSHLLYMQVSVG